MRAELWFGAVLLCASAIAAPQRRPGFMSGMAKTGEWWIYINAVCDPAPTQADALACAPNHSVLSPRPTGVQHTFSDRKTGTWFGYNLEVAKRTGAAFRLRVQPVPAVPGGYEGLREIRLPLYTAPFEVAEGDIVRLPLLVNPSTGTRLVAEIQVYSREMFWNQALGEDAWDATDPSEFTFEKVPFRLENSVLLVNGKEVAKLGGVNSHVVDFTQPGAGRFVFSMTPAPELGFEKRGVIRGRSMLFRIGESEYEWRSTERILPAAGTFNLYVFVDSSPKATGAPGFGWAGWPNAESSVRNR